MRQFLDHGLNITRLHGLYKDDLIRKNSVAVSLQVFRNVFNNIYNISTRYVWIYIWSYILSKSFVYENTL